MPLGRQLAAIMFTDIVGYTALMGKDEATALKALEENRRLHKSTIQEFRGAMLKELGDGVLASFNAASDAVLCAKRIQEAYRNNPQIFLRIGIHLGEVVFEERDVFGDGVNIASRIEQLTPSGGIYISEAVWRNVENKKDIETNFVGEKVLKNVKHSIRIYEVVTEGGPSFGKSPVRDEVASNRSIAILPFVNMSNDPDQEYFCDGLCEELLNSLAQLDKFKVASRTSSFMFKGQNVDIAEVGQKLRVDNVLEGSVRKSKNRVRITAQLISVKDGYHLWSERYDRELEDIFDIQDEIALAIMDSLKLKLLGSEKTTMLKRGTENPEAYQLYLRGRQHFHRFTPDDFQKAIGFYKEAIEIDPTYAKAYAGMASCYLNLWHFDMMPPDVSRPPMIEATHKAVELDDQIAESHVAMARLNFWYAYNPEEAAKEFEIVRQYNPNIPDAVAHNGFVMAFLGKKSEALSLAVRAFELDPFSPMTNLDLAATFWLCQDFDSMFVRCTKMIELFPRFWGGYYFMGYCSWSQGNHQRAISSFEKAIEIQPTLWPMAMLGCLYGIVGQKEKATQVLERMKGITGGAAIANFCFALVYAGLEDIGKALSYLEEAGKERTGHLIFLDIGFRAHRLIPAFNDNPRLEEFVVRAGIPRSRFSHASPKMGYSYR